MVTLWKAELGDYEVYKNLWKEFRYNVLTGPPVILSEEEAKEADKALIEFLGADFLRELEREYGDCSFKRYKDDLQNSQIYLAESEGEIIGYISLFWMGYGRYKISDWALKYPDSSMLISQMFEALLKTAKLPRCEKIILTTLSEDMCEFFVTKGFEKTQVTSFLEFVYDRNPKMG